MHTNAYGRSNTETLPFPLCNETMQCNPTALQRQYDDDHHFGFETSRPNPLTPCDLRLSIDPFPPFQLSPFMISSFSEQVSTLGIRLTRPWSGLECRTLKIY